MRTPFTTIRKNQEGPYSTIQIHDLVKDKSKIELYTESLSGDMTIVDPSLWTLTNLDNHSMIEFYEPYTTSNVLVIQIYPSDFLVIPMNIDITKPMSIDTLNFYVNLIQQTLASFYKTIEKLKLQVGDKEGHSALIHSLEVRINAIKAELESLQAATSHDLHPNPDNPLSDALKALADRVTSEETKLTGIVALTEQERLDLVALEAKLEALLPQHGDNLTPEHIQIIIDALKKSGKLRDHPISWQLVDHAIIADHAMKIQPDGSSGNSKTIMSGSHKPQLTLKGMYPNPELFRPVIKEISLSDAGHTAEQLLLVRLQGYNPGPLTADERSLLVSHDSDAHNWLPYEGAALSQIVINRILNLLYKIPKTGKQTVFNLSELGGGVSDYVDLQHTYGMYETDNTTRMYNSDGSPKIVGGEYATQKAVIRGIITGEQIVKLLKDTTFYNNVEKFMKSNSQPKTDAEKHLPISIADTPGIVIENQVDIHTAEQSYHHFYDMKESFVSLSNGIKVVASTPAGRSKLEGDGAEKRTFISGIFGKVMQDDKELIVEIAPNALIAETKVTDSINYTYFKRFHDSRHASVQALLNLIGDYPTPLANQSWSQARPFVQNVFNLIKTICEKDDFSGINIGRYTKNPQIFTKLT